MPAGRPRMPIDLLQKRGTKHLTKQEIAERKQSEVKVGNKIFEVPNIVKNDVVAYAKWKEIMDIYQDTDFVSSGDSGFLARYCITWSQLMSLMKYRDNIANIKFTGKEFDTAEEEVGENEVNRLFKKINYIMSVEGLLNIETAINKKMELLIKMEDRSFLNPLAKLKGTPRPTEKPKRTPLQKAGFGNV